MNLFRYVFICFLLTAFAGPVLAKKIQCLPPEEPKYVKLEVSNGLTLDQAINASLENSPILKSKQSEVRFAEAQIKPASAHPNPYLEGSESRSENTYFGSLNFVVETGSKRKKRKEAALKHFEAVKNDYQSAIWDLRTAVRKLYTKLSVDLEWIKVKQDRVSLSEQLVNIANKRFEAGDVPKVDIKLSEQALLNSQSELISFKNELVNDRININLKLAFSPLTEWPVETGVSGLSLIPPLKPNEVLTKKALATKPALQEAIFNLQSAEAEVKLAKALRIPNIQESLAVVTSNALNTNTNTPDVFTTSVRADTTIELPVLNTYRGPIAEAKAKMEKLSYDRIFLAQEISSSISGSYEKLKSMQEKVLLAGKNVESSEEIAKLTQEGYEYGRMNLLQVLTSKQNLKLAQDTYFLTLIDLQDAVGELEKALGFPISEAAL